MSKSRHYHNGITYSTKFNTETGEYETTKRVEAPSKSRRRGLSAYCSAADDNSDYDPDYDPFLYD